MHLTCNLSLVSLKPIKGYYVSLSEKHYPHCLVLVVSRNGFEHDFTIKQKYSEGVMVDLHFVKYVTIEV